MGINSGFKVSRREFLKLSALLAGSALLGKYGYDALAKSRIKQISSEVEFVANICNMCSTQCDILVASLDVGGRRLAVKIEGDPNSSYNRGKICARGQAGLRRVYNPNRLKYPLIRVEGSEKGTWNFKTASWDEVINYIKNKLAELTGGDLSKVGIVGGWVTCVAYRPYLFALLKGVGIGWIAGTPVQNCVFGANLGTDLTIGIFNGHAEIMADYDNSDYILIVRSNSSAAGISVGRGERLARAVKNGAKIVVLDPRLSETANLATEWIKIKPGTDPAFLLAMLNYIILNKLYDEEFLKKYTNAPFLLYEPDGGDPVPTPALDPDGNYLVYDNLTKSIVSVPKESNSNEFDVDGKVIDPALDPGVDLVYNGKPVKTVFQWLWEKIKNYDSDWASAICDVPKETIEKIAKEFATASRPVIDPGWYGGRYENSFMLSKLRALLQIFVGGIDREGGWVFTGKGRLPIMKWNMGGAPRVAPSLPGILPIYNLLRSGPWQAPDDLKPPAMFPAMSDVILHAKVKKGDIKVLIVIGSNPLVSMYDKEKWLNTLKNTFVITIDIQPTETILYSDVVLPELTYLERYEAVMPTEAFSVEFSTRFPAMDPIGEGKHFLTILGMLLDVFNEISGSDAKGAWFNTLKAIFGLDDEEKSVFDNMVVGSSNEELPKQIQRFFTWLFLVKRLNLCSKFNIQNCSTPEAAADEFLKILKKGSLEAIPREIVIESKNIPRNLQLPTISGRCEIFSFMLYEAYKAYRNKFGYDPAWDPIVEFPGVKWRDGVSYDWKPSGNEFFVVHGKIPLMSFTSTTNNDLLLSLTSMNPKNFWVWINTNRAKQLGIKTGDLIKITETKTNKSVLARAYVTDLIREDTVFIPFTFKGENGEQQYYREFYSKFGPFVNYTELIPYQPDKILTAYRTNEFTVLIEKA